jgi:hypothetical protein
MCEVIERRQNMESNEWQYYVHYLSCARAAPPADLVRHLG